MSRPSEFTGRVEAEDVNSEVSPFDEVLPLVPNAGEPAAPSAAEPPAFTNGDVAAGAERPAVPEAPAQPHADAPTAQKAPENGFKSKYAIPDFAKDAVDLAAYEDSKKRYIRQSISGAETAIRASFKAKHEQLNLEIKNAQSFEDERRASAMHTTRLYANSYPLRVDKRGVNPPNFFEQLFSFGRAGRLYRAALAANEALEALRTALRKREDALATLDGQLTRALYLKEESIKKATETDAGLAEFHERPEIKSLVARVANVLTEREDYRRRLERKGVPPEEQRDRAMAMENVTFFKAPIAGAIIAKVVRFGPLSYFQLRDLERKESLLSYDSRLDPLRNCVFDVYVLAGSVAAKLRRNDNGTAFRVADHFKACWRNHDEAEELYGQHRSSLRDDRGLPPMVARNDLERETLECLAALAQQVDGALQRPNTDSAS